MKRPLCLICLVLSFILILTAPLKKAKINSYSDIAGQNYTYEGILKDIQYKVTDYGTKQILYLSGEPNIIVYMKEVGIEPRIGSHLRITGKAYSFTSARNEGMFDSLTYYNSIGYSFGINNGVILGSSNSYNHFLDCLYRVRRFFSSKIDLLLPSEESSIIKTMLLGQKKEIDEDLKNLYMRNGIAHILSISGLHISLIGLGVFKLLNRIGIRHKISAGVSSIIIVLYGIMAGFSVSSVRAIMMFILSMVAILVGRTYDLLTSVSLSLLILLLTNSLYAYNSGFLFTFGIIYGIAIILPTLTSPSSSENKLNSVVTTLLSSVSMGIISLPIYYYCYYQVPIYSILLNFIVLPIMSILMAIAFVMLTLSCVWFPLGKLLSFLIIGILKIFKTLSLFFDTLPAHYYTPGRPMLWQIICFIIVSLILYVYRKKLPLKLRYVVTFLVIILLTLRFRPENELCMLDVGQGECIFLRKSDSRVAIPGLTPEFTLLIDGGSTDISQVGKYRIIPFLKFKGASTIDAVFISHTDQDHVNGILEMLDSAGQEGISIKRLILPRISETFKNDSYLSLEAKAVEYDIPISYFSKGDILSYKGLSFKCLWPLDNNSYINSNDDCMVLEAKCSGHSILFTGDISSDIESQITIDSPVDILKVPHHGSRNSSSLEFLSRITPSLCLISCGIDNQYGHPHSETISRLNSINAVILRTDLHGQLTVTVGTVLSVTFFDTG